MSEIDARPPRPHKAVLADYLGRAAPPPQSAVASVRFDRPVPSAKALAELKITDPGKIELAAYLERNAEEFTKQIAGNRELAALLASNPKQALGELKVPPKLIDHVDPAFLTAVASRFSSLQLEFGQVDTGAYTVDPAHAAAVQLLADTMTLVDATPGMAPTLQSDPRTVVTAAAAQSPPGSTPPPGSDLSLAAQASVVDLVSAALAAAGTVRRKPTLGSIVDAAAGGFVTRVPFGPTGG